MLQNYFKIAWRNMIRHKTHTAINLFGMAIAFICSILLILSVFQDLSFDNFHQYGNRIYELYNFENRTEGVELGTTMSYPVATYLKKENLGIDKVTRIKTNGNEIRYRDKVLETGVTLVDNDFFDIFTFPIIAGQAKSPLSSINTLVLNQETADNLFGKEDPLNKEVEIKLGSQWKKLIVSAIVSDVPHNSSIKFDVLARTELAPDWTKNKENWNAQHHRVFVRLSPTSKQENIEKQLRFFVEKYRHPNAEALKNDGYKADENGVYFGMKLHPLKDLHFNSQLGIGETVSKSYLYILLLVSLVILFIACFNFINIQVSLSFTRNKELGVRKCLGAEAKQVWSQLFIENFLQIALSLILGLGGAILLISILNHQYISKLNASVFFSFPLLFTLLLILLLLSTLSSAYPFWVMNRLKTVEIFKGKVTLKKSGVGRDLLIALQFVIAIVLICTTAICYLQFQYLRQAPLGYTTSSLISIPIKNNLKGRAISAKMRTLLSANPAITSISGSMINLGVGKDGSTTKIQMGFDYEGKTIYTALTGADYDFLKTLDIKPLAGRDFSSSFATDSSKAIIITQSMAKQLRKLDVIGLSINTDSTGNHGWHIIGVIPDFHLYSLHEATAPLTIIFDRANPINYLLVKVNTQNPIATMEQVKTAYLSAEPGAEFKGTYVTENVERWYTKEKRLSTLFSVTASIAIILSCMGLFGLALIIIAQRVKEIGIRKVLGASARGITLLVTRQFIKPVFIAIFIAVPIAWWATTAWLQDFIYRITMPWWVFPLAGITVIGIAVLTVGIQSIKAALANPVESLRNE